jgi:ParB family chromosome partitioning protein
VLHNFVLTAFYRFASSGSCLEIGLHTPTFPAQAPGLRESASAKAVEARHESWKARLPKSEKDLWDALTALDGGAQASLFAHCASFAANALFEPANRYNQGRVSAHGVRTRLDQADVLARAVGLDMVQAGWRPTVDNYLGRVTKPRILEAVREARGESSAQLIDHLKKADMAKEAERLLDGSGWLPEPLRLVDPAVSQAEEESEAGSLPEFLAEDEDRENAGDDDPQQLDAAE